MTPPMTRPDDAGARNMLLLTHLRWLAIAGQLGAIVVAQSWLKVALPLVPMGVILVGLVALNLSTLALLRTRAVVANGDLFAALVIDWAALTAQLFLSGGTTNPFAPLGLLQVVLGAVLLAPWSSWVLVILHSLAFGLLAAFHRPLHLPPPFASSLSPLYVAAAWANFTLFAILVVLFVTRIGGNLRRRARHLAELRQRQAEEDHIVRMGLLASGAAHELGTPLSQLSVILGDWRKQPRFARNGVLAEEIEDMQAAVARCKDIVTGILYAAGEARGEAIERTSLAAFVAEVAEAWPPPRAGMLVLDDRIDRDIAIIVDRTLTQVLFNLLDNAAEAGASWIMLRAEIVADDLVLSVRDDGMGFPPAMLAAIGKPYQSSKERRGAGLGLFLTVNVLRKLGGTVAAANAPTGGAVVTLTLPLDALTLEDEHG